MTVRYDLSRADGLIVRADWVMHERLLFQIAERPEGAWFDLHRAAAHEHAAP